MGVEAIQILYLHITTFSGYTGISLSGWSCSLFRCHVACLDLMYGLALEFHFTHSFQTHRMIAVIEQKNPIIESHRSKVTVAWDAKMVSIQSLEFQFTHSLQTSVEEF